MPVSDEADALSPTYKVTIKGDGVDIAKSVDAEITTEILGLVMGRASSATQRPQHRSRARGTATRGGRTSNGGSQKAKRKAAAPGIVKDLSLRPKGKTSFADFTVEKQPATHQQKQAVILYWLREFGSMSEGITTDHVNTCYLEAHWPRPANLANAISVTAKKKGWIDSSELSNIRLTTRGEDEVVHKLPPPPKPKK